MTAVELANSAIQRAVRLIRAHPRVTGVEDNLGVDLSIVVHIDTGLGNRWRARGFSDNGVLAIEPLTFRFSNLYPIDVPDVTLRADFDRSHPHLLPASSSEPPKPCYIDGSPRDLIRLRGPQGLVTQLADWLEKAARAELINPTQGWEPVRRDHLDDFVEVDAVALRSRVDAKGGGTFYQAPFTMVTNGDWRCYCAHFIGPTTLRDNSLQEWSQRFGQVGLGIVVWPGRAASGGPFLAGRYLPESVSSVAELFDHAKSLGVADHLKAQIGLLQRRLKFLTGSSPVLISIILMARRPIDVIGQDSPIELLPYVVEIQRTSDLDETSLCHVRLAAQRDVISDKLMRRMSGKPVSHNPRWTLLGAGSIGSKLALHLAREGSAPRIVVDNGNLRPHNFARHGLLPRHRIEAFNDGKTQALIDAIGLLGQTTSGFHRDVVALCALGGDDERKTAWPNGTQFIVDSTGSPAVTDALCLPMVLLSRPRAIETSLMGGGRVAYLAVEGASSNPNVQDIAAEAYRLISASPTLKETVFAKSGDLVQVGQGCSTLTARMSDATLSAPVPAMAMTLSRMLNGDSTNDGEIILGELDEDLLGQQWNRHAVPPFTIVAGTGTGAPSVRIAAHVANIIERAICARPNVETGGVLMGRFNETTNSFHIVDAIPPPADSEFSASLFLLGIEGLAEVLQSYIDRANGTLFPVGTWHNHLAESSASRTDLATGVQMAFAQTFPALIIIRTPERFHGLVVDAIGSTEPGAESAVAHVISISEVNS